MKRAIPFLLLILIVGLSGCGNDASYSEKESIPKGAWTYENPLVYQFDVKSSETLHDLFFSLTYGVDFGYQNLYVKIITEYPNQPSIEDVVSLNLTNGAGSFLGSCNGSNCTTDILLQEKFRFKESGSHKTTIYQHSREEILQGVFAGELKLYENEMKK